jgi:signal transduction histidine kinase
MADRLWRTPLWADHGVVTFARTRVWLLGALGVGSVLYVLGARIVGSDSPALMGLVWPLLATVPLLGLGLWLASVSDSRQGVYILLSGTGQAVSSVYETLVWANPDLPTSPAFPWLNAVALTADAVATIGGALAIGAFPDGMLERPWQRWVLRLVWVDLLVFPASLAVFSEVHVSGWLGLEATVPNPYAVPSLSWAAPLVDALLVQPWATVSLALVVFASRALFGDAATRARLRFMAATVAFATTAFVLWIGGEAAGLPERGAAMATLQVLVIAAMLALPVAFIHGILVYGAFGVASQERAQVAIRSSWLLIAVLYACAVATPALLFVEFLSPAQAVVLTAMLALALQPVRSRAEAFVRRRVLGDRDKQLALLTTLGGQLEQTMGLDDVLADLAEAIRDGLGASWARIRLIDADGNWSPVREGVSGAPDGEPVVTRDLSSGNERVGRIDLGPRRSGAYSAQELQLLATIARQASTAVANVRLTALLGEQLAELTESRKRLVAAQDDERRRLERDLHDGIQQNVVALIAGLRLARNRLVRGHLDATELVELQDQARETLADLREIAHGIHPPALSDNGLVAAVESRATRFPIPLTVLADESIRSERFSPDVEATAYYVVREALTNTAKHSAATSARVGLSRMDHLLRIEVEDDGQGFEGTARVGHGGLANIRDRVAAVRGRVMVTSTAGSGTLVAAELPVAGGSEPHE